MWRLLNFALLCVAKFCRTVTFYTKELKKAGLPTAKYGFAVKNPWSGHWLQGTSYEGNLRLGDYIVLGVY